MPDGQLGFTDLDLYISRLSFHSELNGNNVARGSSPHKPCTSKIRYNFKTKACWPDTLSIIGFGGGGEYTWLEKKRTSRAKFKGGASLQRLDGIILQLRESITTCRLTCPVLRGLLQVRIDVYRSCRPDQPAETGKERWSIGAIALKSSSYIYHMQYREIDPS